MPNKPKILESNIVAKSQLFQIEALDLQFENGNQRRFERLQGRALGAVMMVPLLDRDTVLLVREYAAGVNDYVLGLPKGLLEKDEDALEAANRELMEEVGYGAKRLTALKSLSAAPGYMASRMQVVLAQDLYEARLQGDEPEEIEVVPWSLQDIHQLLEREDCHEGRTIAALYMVRDRLLRTHS